MIRPSDQKPRWHYRNRSDGAMCAVHRDDMRVPFLDQALDEYRFTLKLIPLCPNLQERGYYRSWLSSIRLDGDDAALELTTLGQQIAAHENLMRRDVMLVLRALLQILEYLRLQQR